MSEEDLDLAEEMEDAEVDMLTSEKPSVEVDSRRRLEQKLEEMRLKKLMDDYDFD